MFVGMGHTASIAELSDDALRAMECAHEVVGDGVVHIRTGSAFVFRKDDILVRVERPGVAHEDVRSHGVAASRLREGGIGSPRLIAPLQTTSTGRVVSLWNWVEHDPESCDIRTLGATLAGVHRTPTSGLPPFNPLRSARVRLSQSHHLMTADEQHFLDQALARAEHLASAVRRMNCFIHGDFNTSNILNAPARPVVIDFEYVGIGNPAWDVAKVAHRSHRFAGHPAADFDEYYGAYRAAGGIAELDQLDDMLSVIDVRSTIWCVSSRAFSPWFASESEVRLETLRNPEATTRWTAL